MNHTVFQIDPADSRFTDTFARFFTDCGEYELFSGRLCRNRYCTFLDFQNRFDKVCRIVFRFVRRSAVRSPASCEIGNGTYSWKFAPAISPVSLHAPKDGIRLPQSVTYLPYPFPHRMAFLLSLGKGSAREIPFFL